METKIHGGATDHIMADYFIKKQTFLWEQCPLVKHMSSPGQKFGHVIGCQFHICEVENGPSLNHMLPVGWDHHSTSQCFFYVQTSRPKGGLLHGQLEAFWSLNSRSILLVTVTMDCTTMNTQYHCNKHQHLSSVFSHPPVCDPEFQITMIYHAAGVFSHLKYLPQRPDERYDP